MTRIVTTILIERPPAMVFDYVTSPGYWPQWHPSSVSAEMPDGQVADHPLGAGEQAREYIAVGSHRDHVVWTALRCECPRHWVISGRAGSGGSAILTYELEAQGPGATLFRRELVYSLPQGVRFLWLGPLIHWQMERSSRLGLRQLKAVLERG